MAKMHNSSVLTFYRQSGLELPAVRNTLCSYTILDIEGIKVTRYDLSSKNGDEDVPFESQYPLMYVFSFMGGTKVPNQFDGRSFMSVWYNETAKIIFWSHLVTDWVLHLQTVEFLSGVKSVRHKLVLLPDTVDPFVSIPIDDYVANSTMLLTSHFLSTEKGDDPLPLSKLTCGASLGSTSTPALFVYRQATVAAAPPVNIPLQVSVQIVEFEPDYVEVEWSNSQFSESAVHNTTCVSKLKNSATSVNVFTHMNGLASAVDQHADGGYSSHLSNVRLYFARVADENGSPCAKRQLDPDVFPAKFLTLFYQVNFRVFEPYTDATFHPTSPPITTQATPGTEMEPHTDYTVTSSKGVAPTSAAYSPLDTTAYTSGSAAVPSDSGMLSTNSATLSSSDFGKHSGMAPGVLALIVLGLLLLICVLLVVLFLLVKYRRRADIDKILRLSGSTAVSGARTSRRSRHSAPTSRRSHRSARTSRHNARTSIGMTPFSPLSADSSALPAAAPFGGLHVYESAADILALGAASENQYDSVFSPLGDNEYDRVSLPRSQRSQESDSSVLGRRANVVVGNGGYASVGDVLSGKSDATPIYDDITSTLK